VSRRLSEGQTIFTESPVRHEVGNLHLPR
jgi:hypothetical protein